MHRLAGSAAALLGIWLFLASAPADAGVLITIDKAAQQMVVEVDGVTRWTWPVSTGRRGYDTPAGNFKPFRMEEDHYSKEWDEAPMPHSIFFTMEGHAIHGSFETRNLGRRASHGCVRLAPPNAEKLFTLVKREGLSNSRVVVRGDADAPLVAKRRTPDEEMRKGQQTQQPAMEPAAGMAYQAAPTDIYRGERAFGYVPAPPANIPAARPQPPQRIVPGWN